MPDRPLSPRLFPVAQEHLTSDDFYTPRWVFERMAITFDFDVSAPPGGIPWIPATRHYTVEDDGLAQPWHGRVWMNPPFSNPAPWVDRFIDHSNGICLVTHARARWCYRLWDTAHALANPGRFYFEGGREMYMPIVFAAFGDECVDAISRIGTVRYATV